MQFGKHSENFTRIRVNNIHIGRVHNDTIKVFEASLKAHKVNRETWIQEQSLEDFGFEITTDTLPKFDELLHSRHYEDRGDWLREKIRHFLNDKTENM